MTSSKSLVRLDMLDFIQAISRHLCGLLEPVLRATTLRVDLQDARSINIRRARSIEELRHYDFAILEACKKSRLCVAIGKCDELHMLSPSKRMNYSVNNI